MEIWIPLALLSPLLFASSNFVDKYVIEKITRDNQAAVITILFGLAGIPFLAFFGGLASDQLSGFGLINSLGAITVGLLALAGYYFYYKTLVEAEASVVATLWQLIVVFNYLLGRIFLDERLSSVQLAGIALVVVGSVVISLESREEKFRLNKKIFGQMLLASFIISVTDVLFKSIAQDTAYLPTQFYEYSAGVIAGIVLLVFHKSARRSFANMFRRYRATAVKASLFNEVVNLGGVISMRYAMFLAPVAVVQAVMSIQTLYLVILGVILTRLFPRYVQEDISRKHLVQKIAAVGLILVGTTILALTS